MNWIFFSPVRPSFLYVCGASRPALPSNVNTMAGTGYDGVEFSKYIIGNKNKTYDYMMIDVLCPRTLRHEF